MLKIICALAFDSSSSGESALLLIRKAEHATVTSLYDPKPQNPMRNP